MRPEVRSHDLHSQLGTGKLEALYSQDDQPCRRSDMTDAMDPVGILASLSDPSRCRPNGRAWSMERTGELRVLYGALKIELDEQCTSGIPAQHSRAG